MCHRDASRGSRSDAPAVSLLKSGEFGSQTADFTSRPATALFPHAFSSSDLFNAFDFTVLGCLYACLLVDELLLKLGQKLLLLLQLSIRSRELLSCLLELFPVTAVEFIMTLL